MLFDITTIVFILILLLALGVITRLVFWTASSREDHARKHVEEHKTDANRTIAHPQSTCEEAENQELAMSTFATEMAPESACLHVAPEDVRRVFLSLINHELRTPLSIIINNANLLESRRSDPLSVRQAAAVDSINRNAHRLIDLFETMINYADMQSVDTMPHMKATSVEPLCRTVVAATDAMAQAKFLHVEYAPADLPLQVWGNAYYLTRALTVIVENAIAFTPADGRIGLEIAVDDDVGTVLITIWDTGIGIPSTFQQRIFEPFFQVDSSHTRQHNGLGLGLALTKRVIELHDGTIRVESHEGTGSRFIVALPVLSSAPLK